MIITATLNNNSLENTITVSTDDNEKILNIPSKSGGKGSSVNGGELLFLALATCFCNDVYREAAHRKMDIDAVACSVLGNFGKPGETGSDISYRVTVTASKHSQQEIHDLIRYVDLIAEIHNTLRKGTSVSLIL